jgi:hypothetical protein
MIAVLDPTIGAILAAAIPSLIGGVVAFQLKKLDRKNSEQHAVGACERAEISEKFERALSGIHDDVLENIRSVGRIEGKLDAHLDEHRRGTFVP